MLKNRQQMIEKVNEAHRNYHLMNCNTFASDIARMGRGVHLESRKSSTKVIQTVREKPTIVEHSSQKAIRAL